MVLNKKIIFIYISMKMYLDIFMFLHVDKMCTRINVLDYGTLQEIHYFTGGA